jgi:hypothetical protein
LKTLRPTPSSWRRPEILRLLLACGGLSLLLIGARGQSDAVGLGAGIDGVVSHASAMVSGVADTRIPNDAPPVLSTTRTTVFDNSFDDDDDDDGGDEVLVERHGHFHVTAPLNNTRLSSIDPASSRDFATLPLRAPPV